MEVQLIMVISYGALILIKKYWELSYNVRIVYDSIDLYMCACIDGVLKIEWYKDMNCLGQVNKLKLDKKM